ncbi:hypothetical protein [Galbibacter sp. PAP.153]|uniref:hypothetical protein n=1 Tax=Galbibacter sp. PAP.153 TaxID=3104623 RepID=UPI0030090B44
MNFSSVLSRIERNNPLDFGNIFSKSIDLFKKTWGQGVLLVVATIILMIPAMIILYIPIIGAAVVGSNNPEMQAGNVSPWTMLPFFLLLIPVMLVMQTVMLGLMAGYYKMVHKRDMDMETSTGDMFVFLKGIYLKKLFTLSFFSIGIALLAALLCYFPVIYVSVPLAFVSVVFAFNPELSPKEIIKLCFKLGNKKWLISFGLIFISGFLAQLVGMLLCGIGIFFTASFAYLPVYQVYKETVGFEDEDEIGQIGTSEV